MGFLKGKNPPPRPFINSKRISLHSMSEQLNPGAGAGRKQGAALVSIRDVALLLVRPFN
jgi:hypothetical protein